MRGKWRVAVSLVLGLQLQQGVHFANQQPNNRRLVVVRSVVNRAPAFLHTDGHLRELLQTYVVGGQHVGVVGEQTRRGFQGATTSR